MKIIDNRNDILHEDLKQEIKKGSKISISATLLSEISGMEDFERCLTQSGLGMNVLYENIVRQIAGDALAENKQESLQDSVERELKRQVLQKKIKALEGKIHKEKQLNRQMKMNGELKQLKKELGALWKYL